MKRLAYHICISKGTEIYLLFYLTYYLSSLYSLPATYNIYPIINETDVPNKAKSSCGFIQIISNITKYLNTSKFKTFNIQL